VHDDYHSIQLAERNGNLGVSLEVFDMLGKKVTTLLHKDLEAGFYKADWDVNDGLNSNGLYIYRLTVDDNGKSEILTGKLILKK